MSKVFGVTGWKNSGKTTLVSALVAEFTRRGLTISTVKHAHESFDIDHAGTDSHSHRKAGAQEVALVSNSRWALMHEIKSQGAAPSLNQILSKLAPCDLVLVEGFKNSPIPKIECIREQSQSQSPLWVENDSILAVATDRPDEVDQRPSFDLSDIDAIADFIAQISGLGR